MRVTRSAGLVLFAGLLSNCSAPESLGNGEARAVIERLWNQPDVGLLLGEIKFVAENPDPAKGRESIKEWPLYEAFARSGVLTLGNVKDLTQQFGGWSDWLSLTQSGVRKTATVGLSELGKAKGSPKKVGDFDELWLKVAATRVERIVANEHEIVGSDKYRVVQGTHTYEIPPEMSAAFEVARGWDHVNERRFKVLLKFDPFDKEWKMVTADVGKRTEDFRSNNVGQNLQALKLGIR